MRMKRGAKAVFAVLAVAAGGLASSVPARVDVVKTVHVNPGPYLDPPTLVIQRGEEVLWLNRTGYSASVEFWGGEGAPRMLDDVTTSATARFEKAGRYEYFVRILARSEEVIETLKGEVIVKEAGTPGEADVELPPKTEAKDPAPLPSPPSPRQLVTPERESARVDHTELKRGVVKIIAHKSQNVKDTGAGIVVGIEKNIALILTAHHVVEGAKTIEVVFFDKQFSKFHAMRFEKYDEDLDIAVITVDPAAGKRIPANLPRFTLGDVSKLREGEKVSTLGHPLDLDWQVSINANTIARLNDRGDFRKFRFTKSAIERGSSGGPVFDERGSLIGMVTKFDPLHAVAVKMDATLLVLKEAWGIPTTNLNRP